MLCIYTYIYTFLPPGETLRILPVSTDLTLFIGLSLIYKLKMWNLKTFNRDSLSGYYMSRGKFKTEI